MALEAFNAALAKQLELREATNRKLEESISQGMFSLSDGAFGSRSQASLAQEKQGVVASVQQSIAAAMRSGDDSAVLAAIQEGALTLQPVDPEGSIALTDMWKQFQPEAPKDDSVYKQKIKDIVNAPWLSEEQKIEMINQNLGGSGTSTNVSVNTGGVSQYDKTSDIAQAESDREVLAGVEIALNSVEKTNQVLNLLESGEPTVGFGAEFFNDVNRVLTTLGFEGDNVKSASSTQLLNALLGSDVFPMIAQLGIGARGLDTPAEREFLREVMTGTINLEGEALKEMTRLRQYYSRKILKKYNEKLGQGHFNKYIEATGIELFPAEIPEIIRPNGSESGTDQNGNVIYKYPNGNLYSEDGAIISWGKSNG